MDLIFDDRFASITCKYLTPFSSIPQYFKDNLVKTSFVPNPMAKFYRPLVPIKLSSSFNFFIFVKGRVKTLPRN